MRVHIEGVIKCEHVQVSERMSIYQALLLVSTYVSV